MKVRLITKNTIFSYVRFNRASETSFENWLDKLKVADWNIPSDIVSHYISADLLGGGSNRVVFNIKGNHYRMICQYDFTKNLVHLYVCWIGTHAEYDRICSLNLQYTISDY